MPQPNKSLQTSLTLLTLIAFVLMGFTPSHGQETEKPNVLYILADDLGYGEIQAYNPTRGKVPTPNVNRLARQGMMFTDAHSASAVCTPTRYAFLTGRYSWRSRLQKGVIGPGGHNPLIKKKFKTLGHLYASKGYHTAILGKWHLGYKYSEKNGDTSNRTAPAPVGANVIGGPTTRGFDYFWGFALSRTMSTVVENDKVVKELPVKKMLPTLARKGAKYVGHQSQNDRPFFLYLALNSPHGPVVPTERFQGKTGLNDWADYVMETDWAVGQVLQALHKSGEADNTIVVFASDNGTSPGKSNVHKLERQGYFPSALLRGYKRHIWEGGHRIPFIVRWPGVVEPGSKTDFISHFIDLMPTLVDVSGAEYPDQYDGKEVVPMQGTSLLPVLNGKDIQRKTPIYNEWAGGKYIITHDWKLVQRRKKDRWELIPFDKNRTETINKIDERPQKAKQLKQAWKSWKNN